MINSMTGYGSAQGRLKNITYLAEIKTLNNRYLKTKIKLPENVAFLEADIEHALCENLSRGMVIYSLSAKGASADSLFDIDEKALKAYTGRLLKIAAQTKTNATVDIATLMVLPGILKPKLPDEKTVKQMRKTVLDITAKALDKTRQMRKAEGKALRQDLRNHCTVIKNLLKKINRQSETSLKKYREKLRKRVNELLRQAKVKLEEDALAREVAIFADRSDTSEETARLDSHLSQFTTSLQSKEPAGRRLDFLTQEMFREANTIASKAADAETAQWALELKSRIDKIKEQVQNIE